MRKLGTAALIGLLASGLVPGTTAFAVECTFVAPYERTSERELPDDAPLAGQPPNARSGSEGPTSTPRAERSKDDSEARRRDGPPDGGPGKTFQPLQNARQPHLDVEGFTAAIDRKFRQASAGYVMQLRQNGTTLSSKSYQWAKRPGDGGLSWDAGQRMHIASISKLVTAIALVKLLDDKGIDENARIIDYLPEHWAKGENIDKITFAQLMRHETGFRTGTYYADYRFMRRQIANGVAAVGSYTYQNINFGLIRVLIPIINGDIGKNAQLSEDEWDDKTLEAYDAYMQRVVFAPSGVTGATLKRPPEAALAYGFPPGPGWNSGKLTCIAGTAAYFMSVSELLDVLGTFRRGGKIVSAQRAQALLDRKFGIDRLEQAGAGTFYIKSGRWWRSETPPRPMEQSVAYLLPEGMELALFVNSQVGKGDEYLVDVVTEIYQQHVSYH